MEVYTGLQNLEKFQAAEEPHIQRLIKANNYIPIAPLQSNCLLPSGEVSLIQSLLLGELAWLVADSSGIGVGNCLFNSSCFKLLPPFLSLKTI